MDNSQFVNFLLAGKIKQEKSSKTYGDNSKVTAVHVFIRGSEHRQWLIETNACMGKWQTLNSEVSEDSMERKTIFPGVFPNNSRNSKQNNSWPLLHVNIWEGYEFNWNYFQVWSTLENTNTLDFKKFGPIKPLKQPCSDNLLTFQLVAERPEALSNDDMTSYKHQLQVMSIQDDYTNFSCPKCFTISEAKWK